MPSWTPDDVHGYDIPLRGERSRDTCIPLFFTQPKKDGAASSREGRPIYRDTPFVKILIPGDNRTEFVGPVTDEHKHRWPSQWAEFERSGNGEAVEGTMLEEWPAVSRSQVKELEHYNIRTVEQLAGLSDAGMQATFPGIRKLTERAKQWLDAAEGGQAAAQLQTKLDHMQAQLDARDAQIADMERRMSDMQDQRPKRGPGRPRKEVTEDVPA